jgi:SAM-dependent methyltransferase
MTSVLRRIGRSVLPGRLRAGIGNTARTLSRWPPIGLVDWGDLRRTTPISGNWGFDRGQPVDRYYIDLFLGAHSSDIRGTVLEIKHPEYTRRFGRGVASSDVLDLSTENPDATVVADLTSAPHLPGGVYDCVILTQTLQFIFDADAALDTLQRILKPDGVLLITVPAVSPISMEEFEDYGEFWRFTSMSLRRMLDARFGETAVEAFGSVLTATAFLHGVAAGELRDEELAHRDPRFEVLLAGRAANPHPAGARP